MPGPGAPSGSESHVRRRVSPMASRTRRSAWAQRREGLEKHGEGSAVCSDKAVSRDTYLVSHEHDPENAFLAADLWMEEWERNLRRGQRLCARRLLAYELAAAAIDCHVCIQYNANSAIPVNYTTVRR